MDCGQVNEEIELFILGDLPETERTAITEHLASCHSCKAIETEYRFLVAKIRESNRSDLPSPEFTFASKVRSAVKAEIRRASYCAAARRVIPAVWSIAACLLIALAGWWMWVSSGIRLQSMLAEGAQRRSLVRSSAAPSIYQLWQHKSAPSAPGSMADAVVVYGRSMYLLQEHGRQNYVAALDTQTGERKWISNIKSSGYLLADDARVYCLSPGGARRVNLVALDAADGSLLWKHTRDSTNRLLSPCRPSLLGDGRICWTADRTVYMLKRVDGQPIWTHSIPDGRSLSEAVVVDSDLYVANSFGLYCLDAVTGQESWRLACGDITSGRRRPMLAAADGEVYASMSLGLRSSRLFCMDAAQRKILWSRIVDCAARLDAIGDVLYVRDQNIQALEGTTGRLLWSCPAEGCNPVTYAEDLAYFVDSRNQGRLVALDRYTGARVWELAGVKSCDAFIRVDGRGFLKTPDGVVRALIFKG